jgi:hypothetical protein
LVGNSVIFHLGSPALTVPRLLLITGTFIVLRSAKCRAEMRGTSIFIAYGGVKS